VKPLKNTLNAGSRVPAGNTAEPHTYSGHFLYLGLFLLLVLALGVVLSAPNAYAAGENTEWKWSKDNPKPEWWYWGEKYDTSKPVRGGYLRQAGQRYVGLLNPNHWPVNDWWFITYIYESPINTDGDYKPSFNWMFESWEYTSQKSAQVRLRKGVKFHDGTDFNAEGYKFQLEWIKNRDNSAWTRAYIAPITSIEVVDEYTLNFTFNKVWTAFPGVISFVPGWPISPKALKADTILTKGKKLKGVVKKGKKKVAKLKKKAAAQTGEAAEKTAKKILKAEKSLAKVEKDLAAIQEKAKDGIPLDIHGVGTGMFMMEEARPGNYLKLKRNPNWWFGKSIGKPEMPYYDGVIANVIPDLSVQLANLRAGKIDEMAVDPSLYDQVKNDPNLVVSQYPLTHSFMFSFNHTNKPLDDVRVRKAISHAIDRKAIIEGTQFGFATASSSLFPEYHWSHNPNLKSVEYDPELSKKLLKEAGLENGFSIKGFAATGIEHNVALVVQNMLKQVGIDWTFSALAPVALTDKMRNLDYDFMPYQALYITDPDPVASGLYHPEGPVNNGRNKNSKAIELIEKARTELDVEKRQALYWEFEKALYDNYEDVWLYWPSRIWVNRKNVRGFNVPMYIKGQNGYLYSHPQWFEGGKQ